MALTPEPLSAAGGAAAQAQPPHLEQPYDVLLQTIRRRRSVRKFQPGRPVSRETLLRIMEAGRWAPSGANAQPWDFICVDEPDVRQQVLQVFLRQGQRLLEHVTRFPAVNKSFLAHTSAIILVLGDPRWKAAFPQGNKAAWQDEYAANNDNIFYCSLGAAIQNLQLAITACGLTSAWLSGGGETRTAAELREILGFPASARPHGTVPIGYPAKEVGAKWRRPLEQMVHWNRFEPEQYRPQPMIDFYVNQLRPFAMYRPFETIDEWEDAADRVGDWGPAFSSRVSNPGGKLPQ